MTFVGAAVVVVRGNIAAFVERLSRGVLVMVHGGVKVSNSAFPSTVVTTAGPRECTSSVYQVRDTAHHHTSGFVMEPRYALVQGPSCKGMCK